MHFPLPYMTGSLLITAALGLAGVPMRSLWQARAAGQFVTGSAIGTSFTPAVLVEFRKVRTLCGVDYFVVGQRARQ